jgi:aminopeptidase I
MTSSPTVFHAITNIAERLASHGFTKLSERDAWSSKLKRGGKYFFERNGSGMIIFTIGDDYKSGNGAAIIASHIDALTAKVKPVSTKPTVEGYMQLGIAPYAGAINNTWLDRDLGIGGRVFVKDQKTGKIEEKLAKLDWPIARIPTIAEHFGLPKEGQLNKETRMTPIIGLDNSDLFGGRKDEEVKPTLLGPAGSFAATVPPRLLKAIAKNLDITDLSSIINWELEVFDFQPATVGGLDKEFIFAGRIDDKLCSFAAVEALLLSSTANSGLLRIVGLFDDEEVGSLLRQGARGNFLPSTVERICEAFADSHCTATLYQTYANSFLISADVCHAVNPNYMDVYLHGHMPRLNVGVALSFDSSAHMTTDGASSTLLQRIAEKSGSVLQPFQIRNDSRSGGTVGPMLSAMTGIRAADAGIPQLSMHSIRATTGSLDPGLGVKLFAGFFEHFESVDKEFQ